MNPRRLETRYEAAGTYLQHLQALASAISRGMHCISTNALAGFRESVAHQEALCAHIAGMGAVHSQDAVLNASIQEARSAIRELNLQYAALLRHSGKSLALLTSLCRTYKGQEARGTGLKHQTWSCEM